MPMGQQNIQENTQLSRALTTAETESGVSGYEALCIPTEEGDGYTLSVLVSGVHCAGCIQKIESTLLKHPEFQFVRLNFSTRRLSLQWRGEAAKANEYVREVESLGYNVQPYDPNIEKEGVQAQARFLLLCLGVSGFAMGNIMMLSIGLWATSSEVMGVATQDFMHWISAVIAVPSIIFAGRPFFNSAIKALRAGHTNMDVPISLALVLASGMSLFETIRHGEHVYFDSAVMLMFFLLIGRYLDLRARQSARSTATDLLSTLTGFANVVEGNQTRRVLIRDLQEDMLVRVSVGEKIPVDGVVVVGVSEVDTSLVTGETLPREVKKDVKVFAGTMNLSAPITMKVEKAAEDSLLSDIVRLMEQAGQGQAKYVRLADRAAKIYTPLVHFFALSAFLYWWGIGGIGWQDSLMIAITVLIITCPCALGLAVPVVQVLASGTLLTSKILVKSGDALERLAEIDTVFLDKTGTLTMGQPYLENVGDFSQEVLRQAVSLAAHSQHPLSTALRESYQGALLQIEDVQEHAGKGVEGQLNGQLVRLGRRTWCGDMHAPKTEKIELWFHVDGQAPVVFYFSDILRADTPETIERLKHAGRRIVMLSGDLETVAARIGKQAGITEIFAEKTPTEKFEIVTAEKEKGHKVLMVGDGLNDAPVLAAADVSMAPGTAIDMAQNAADIVFMGVGLSPVYQTYNIAQETQKLVRQNFILAIAYNVVAIPLALVGFVTPFVAAIAMSGSSLIVIANSFRLKLKQKR